MSVTFCNIPHSDQLGGLWFVIPDDLQQHVIPWIKSKLHEVDNIADRKHFRRQLTKESLSSGDGHDIWWKSHLGNTRSVIYHRDGIWRVGNRGAAASLMQDIQEDFLAELKKYAEMNTEFLLGDIARSVDK